MSSPDMAFWDHDNDRDVDMVQGAYMMLPAEVYRRLGGFDETLPMFLEDNELCVRIWQNGYKIRYLSTVSILHHVGASTRKAQAKWISELRYESYRRVIERSQGARMAKTYVLILPFVLMIKLGLLPFLCLGMYLRNGVCYFAQHLFETLHGFSWVWQKLTAPEKDYYSTSSPFSNVDARETDHPT